MVIVICTIKLDLVKVSLDIHAIMKNANNLDSFQNLTIKNSMSSDIRKALRYVRHPTRNNTNCKNYLVGGCQLLSIHNTLAPVAYSLFSRKITVARPIGVRPVIWVPPLTQLKCSCQNCCLG